MPKMSELFIIVHGETVEDHDVNLKKVDVLQDHGITLA